MLAPTHASAIPDAAPATALPSVSHQLWARPSARFSIVTLTIYLLIAVVGYLGLLPDIDAVVGGSQEPPSLAFATLLGTDVLGRSVFFRVLAGAETAVTIGLLTALLVIPLGTALGLVAGYVGGWVDSVVMWVYSVVVSIPGILLITAISYSIGRGVGAMCVALAATLWVGIMRLVRGEVLRHRSREYVLAARAIGVPPLRIMYSEVLPNVMHVAIVTFSLILLEAVKAEVILTFLGLGVQDGASWGILIAGATQELVNDIWWPLAGTMAAMFAFIYSLSVLADTLRDVLDPKTRGTD